jgi:hypothetical protein
MMPESALSRYAGPIVLTVGAYVAVTHLVLQFVFTSYSDPAAMLADPVYRVVNLAYAAAFSGLAIAACAAYDRQAREAGTFGLVALCAAIVGTVNLGADRGLRRPLARRRGTRNTHRGKDDVLEGRLPLKLRPLLPRLGALRTCLPESPRLSASHQPRDRGRRSHWLPGSTTAVRHRAGVGAVEPRDLDGQDWEDRQQIWAADHCLIALWTGSRSAYLVSG